METSCISASMSDLRYFLVYKPFGCLSQFTREMPEHQTLADLFHFPSDVYPVGRLDADSEGILLLTNDKTLNDKLLNPVNKHWRTYLVQVEGVPSTSALVPIEKGVKIKIRKKEHLCLPAKINIIPEPDNLPERFPPVRFRQNIPTSWVKLSLQEGKNRQVRKMMAAVGFPVLRLVRFSIENLHLTKQESGRVEEIKGSELYKKLKILN